MPGVHVEGGPPAVCSHRIRQTHTCSESHRPPPPNCADLQSDPAAGSSGGAKRGVGGDDPTANKRAKGGGGAGGQNRTRPLEIVKLQKRTRFVTALNTVHRDAVNRDTEAQKVIQEAAALAATNPDAESDESLMLKSPYLEACQH